MKRRINKNDLMFSKSTALTFFFNNKGCIALDSINNYKKILKKTKLCTKHYWMQCAWQMSKSVNVYKYYTNEGKKMT